MAANSAIEWTDATVNFWWGCTKVGPGCDHCYAETWAKRTGHSVWGLDVPRRQIKSAVALLDRLNRDSVKFADEHDGRIRRVFIQSMSDLFDLEVYDEWFAGAWVRIREADCLDLQIVTKRISAVEKRLAQVGCTEWPKHAGLMITVVNQTEADRDVPRLLALKAKLGIPWVGLSIEPMLGPIDLENLPSVSGIGRYLNALSDDGAAFSDLPTRLDWVIVGGESGSHARPMNGDWARDVRDQCEAACVPFLFKQHGEWIGVSDIRRLPGGSGPGFGSYDHNAFDMEHQAVRVGKKTAGRLLDGVTHDGFPEGRT